MCIIKAMKQGGKTGTFAFVYLKKKKSAPNVQNKLNAYKNRWMAMLVIFFCASQMLIYLALNPFHHLIACLFPRCCECNQDLQLLQEVYLQHRGDGRLLQKHRSGESPGWL